MLLKFPEGQSFAEEHCGLNRQQLRSWRETGFEEIVIHSTDEFRREAEIAVQCSTEAKLKIEHDSIVGKLPKDFRWASV
jgi:hypothetical protein